MPMLMIRSKKCVIFIDKIQKNVYTNIVKLETQADEWRFYIE